MAFELSNFLGKENKFSMELIFSELLFNRLKFNLSSQYDISSKSEIKNFTPKSSNTL